MEEGDKEGIGECKPAQGEFDQREPALGNLAQGKPAQEELVQLSVSQEVTRAIKEREKKTEDMEEEASKGSSGPVDNRSPAEGGHGSSAQQQPQKEADMPQGTMSLHAGDVNHHSRFTHSQLHILENLFQDTGSPSLCTR